MNNSIILERMMELEAEKYETVDVNSMDEVIATIALSCQEDFSEF